jgi:hypothetical protein
MILNLKKKLRTKLAIILAIISILSGTFLIEIFLTTSREISSREIDNNSFKSNIFISSDGKYDFGQNFINSTGSNLNVSLVSFRNETISGSSTMQEGIIIDNDNKLGWNMSKFSLNFIDITAKEELVKFQTRIDGAVEFKAKIAKRFYANSFEIPNTCIINNLSVFLQYPGGSSPLSTEDSSFNITVYNSTIDGTPGTAIHNITEDDIHFDLTSEPTSQPAKWYTSNFTNRILNISKTYNKTFFAVFQTIDFPGSWFGDPPAYMYYAEKQESDPYNLSSYSKTNITDWIFQPNKTGLLKVGFSPISTNPSSEEINITVFNEQVQMNSYEYNTFFEHQDNEFFIPISSPWFGEVS